MTGVDITDPTKMPAIGVIQSKSTPTLCVVQVAGPIPIGSLDPGKIYFIGHTKQASRPCPVPAPGSSLMVQIVGMALDENRLMLEPNYLLTKRIG